MILRNKTEIALPLLESGASVDAPDRTARTPLHLAVERANVALVTALLERHARSNERDAIGWTPLHHAAAPRRGREQGGDRRAVGRGRQQTLRGLLRLRPVLRFPW